MNRPRDVRDTIASKLQFNPNSNGSSLSRSNLIHILPNPLLQKSVLCIFLAHSGLNVQGPKIQSDTSLIVLGALLFLDVIFTTIKRRSFLRICKLVRQGRGDRESFFTKVTKITRGACRVILNKNRKRIPKTLTKFILCQLLFSSDLRKCFLEEPNCNIKKMRDD